MERLTERGEDGKYFVRISGDNDLILGAEERLLPGLEIWTGWWEHTVLGNIVDRLAAYEDTGFTPEEVQQMRWIPVEERLPEEIGNYLVVACDEHLPRDERIWNGTIMGEGFCGEEGWDMEYSGYIHDITGMVTHWMPFPDFPKEETDGEF